MTDAVPLLEVKDRSCWSRGKMHLRPAPWWGGEGW